MNQHSVILSVGRDSDLLRTRNQVLKSVGNAVVSARNTLELVEKFYNGDFDLVLLCHTVPVEEQRAICNLVHHRSPSTPVVVVTVGEMGNDFADATVPNNPNALITAISTLLNRKPMGRVDSKAAKVPDSRHQA